MLLYSIRRALLSLGFVALIVVSLILWSTTWRPPLKFPKTLTYYNGSGYLTNTILSEKCNRWIDSINVSVPGMLIDEFVLQQLHQNICDLITLEVPIKVSIPKNFPSQNVGNLMIPTQIPTFLEFWNRGRFMDCRNFTMHRDSSKRDMLTPLLDSLFPPREPIPALESVENLANLRDEMLRFGIFPFLNGGTFLGWYRECSVIPHTTDMDIAILAENWSSEFSEFLWTHNSSFRVKRQLGLVNDSYELTLIPKTGFKTPIDVFLMYKDSKDLSGNRWVGGLTTTGVKYKYIYPDYDPWCAADLMGHFFWVSCTPEDKIKKEYGNNWYLDENSSKYTWNKARNAVENGRFTWKQMQTETYNEYKLNDLS